MARQRRTHADEISSSNDPWAQTFGRSIWRVYTDVDRRKQKKKKWFSNHELVLRHTRSSLKFNRMRCKYARLCFCMCIGHCFVFHIFNSCKTLLLVITFDLIGNTRQLSILTFVSSSSIRKYRNIVRYRNISNLSNKDLGKFCF